MTLPSSPWACQYDVVLGSPRSGTTFLMRVFNAAPDLEALSGVIYPPGLLYLVNHPASEPIRPLLALELRRTLNRYLHTGLYRSRAARLQKWYASGGGPAGLLGALRGERPPCTHIIYKEPFFSFAPAFVYEALPEARFVHIFRDGRDCADSMMRKYGGFSDERLEREDTYRKAYGRPFGDTYVPWWVEAGHEKAYLASSSYVRSIWRWKFMVGTLHTFFSRPDVANAGRVLPVRYEDLMRHPLEEGRRVTDHLGVPFTKQVARTLKQAHTRSIGIHRRLPEAEICAAEAVARAELEQYGYL